MTRISDPARSRAGHRSPSRTLVALGILTLLACLPVVVTTLGQRADERSRWAVAVPWRTGHVLDEALGLVSVEFIAVVAAIAALFALTRRRASRALAAVVVVGGANVGTQVLKALIPRPDHGIGAAVGNTLPSGHTTVVTSLALAALFVVPVSWRRAVTFLAAGAGTLTGAAVLILRWHRPSDVVAAYAVCAIAAGVGLRIARRVSPSMDGARTGPLPRLQGRSVRAGHAVAAFAGAMLAGGLLIVAGLAAHPDEPSALLGAIVLSAMGITCAILVSLTAIGLDDVGAGPPARRVVGGRR